MSTTNATELTRSHAVYRAKKRAKKLQIQEVIFDDDARREYLTGFRKRNLLKKEAKQKNAKERARLERLELRKEHRRELAERAAQNVKEVEGALGANPESTFPDSSNTQKEVDLTDELEFEDEEQLATVTVVEDFVPDSLIHLPPQRHLSSDSDPGTVAPGTVAPGVGFARSVKSAPQRKSTTVREGKMKAKAKASKFRYEAKAGRKAERTKQIARHTEKAERAGGKDKRRSKR